MIVSNTSILIFLTKLGRIDLIRELYGRVAIPQAVFEELLAKSPAEGATLQPLLNIEKETTDLPGMDFLDHGEQHAIRLATAAH
ncbi:hypothetical protein HY641_00050 [Candidatus Woesearchaeota archaeon]|nr:hypothetical protein [Candidatus Woesearchaeota archaeon]